VSSIDAISSSASTDREFIRKSLSILLLLMEVLYQYIKNEINTPSKLIFQIKSKITNGIKIVPSFDVSISIKNRIFEM